MSEPKLIKPFESYVGVPDVEIVNRGTNVVTKLTGNSNFQNPPVALVDLKADVDKLSELMAEAVEGGQKVVAEKKKQRGVVIKKLRLLGRYVEYSSILPPTALIFSGLQKKECGRPGQLSPQVNIKRV